jgi:formylmethanofuran dehydrogenase subunit B
MAEAWIRGSPAALQAAIAESAKLLQASRMPVIAGLGSDVAGARAAIRLAQRVGGAIDHMHSTALLRDLDVMREAGMMVTTPNETRLRADLLLLVGPGLVEAWPDLPARLLDDQKRRIVWLCPGSAARDARSDQNILIGGGEPADLPVVLAALRAQIAKRPTGQTPPSAKALEKLAAELAKARFGVAVWSAAQLDGLTLEMLCGLVKDLNESTRFSGLPLTPDDNAAAIQQVSGWMTGFPLRTGFGRFYPEHDPWRFDAARLVESGEADCALWISACRAVSPPWRRNKIPLIALAQEPDGLAAEVVIAVGRPGIDHDAVMHSAATGTLAAVTVEKPAGVISVADAIGRIAAALPKRPPC